jgi:hypothetical protein
MRSLKLTMSAASVAASLALVPGAAAHDHCPPGTTDPHYCEHHHHHHHHHRHHPPRHGRLTFAVDRTYKADVVRSESR